MVTNSCLFCYFSFTCLAIKSSANVEGHQVTQIECPNCGAKFKSIMIIEGGPARKFVKNIRTQNEETAYGKPAVPATKDSL